MNFLIVLFLFLANFGQGPPVDLENVPLPVSKCLQQTGKVLEVNRRMNPFYLRGDFNGDGKMDFVVLVQDRKSKKEGFAFCFAGRPEGHVVGAGSSIAVEGGVLADDFSELDNWGVADGWSTRPRRDGVYVAKSEAGSAVLIWNGQKSNLAADFDLIAGRRGTQLAGFRKERSRFVSLADAYAIHACRG